jgi:hypothetical protein
MLALPLGMRFRTWSCHTGAAPGGFYVPTRILLTDMMTSSY